MAREGVNAATLAEKAGVSEPGVSKWLKKGQIARKHIPKLCEVLNCSADELFGIRGAGSHPPARLANDRLAEAIEIVELGLAEAKVKLPASKRASLISAVYELAEETGRRVESATILRLVRLAS